MICSNRLFWYVTPRVFSRSPKLSTRWSDGQSTFEVRCADTPHGTGPDFVSDAGTCYLYAEAGGFDTTGVGFSKTCIIVLGRWFFLKMTWNMVGYFSMKLCNRCNSVYIFILIHGNICVLVYIILSYICIAHHRRFALQINWRLKMRIHSFQRGKKIIGHVRQEVLFPGNSLWPFWAV